ncbi:MAG: hypothetical protein ABI795_07100, partial [Chthoniobacterales bacterium]
IAAQGRGSHEIPFALVAGLRLDTTAWHSLRPDRHWAPRWQKTEREPHGCEARHPPGLLKRRFRRARGLQWHI